MLFTCFFSHFLTATFVTPFPSRRFLQKPGKRWCEKGVHYIDFFDYFWKPSKRPGTPQPAMENGLFCGTFGVPGTGKFLRFGLKSNKETPKEISEEGLRSLRPLSDYSLEFPYCFWTPIFVFSHFLTLGSEEAVRFRGP